MSNTLDNKQTRRYKVLAVDDRVLIAMLEKAGIIRGLPSDAQVLRATTNEGRMSIEFLVSSESFDDVPLNQMPPYFVGVTYSDHVDLSERFNGAAVAPDDTPEYKKRDKDKKVKPTGTNAITPYRDTEGNLWLDGFKVEIVYPGDPRFPKFTEQQAIEHHLGVTKPQRLDDEGPNDTFDYVRDGRLPTSEQMETEE